MPFYYYGTRDRLESSAHCYSVWVTTTDGLIGLAEFLDAQEAALYDALLRSIRWGIADINERRDRGLISESTRCQQLRTTWIASTVELTNNFGHELVPEDIRNAIDSVRQGVRLPALSWPRLPTIERVDSRWVFSQS